MQVSEALRRRRQKRERLPFAFRTLRATEGASQLGWEITTVAAPLVALLELNSSPTRVALLSSLLFAPVLVVGPVAGIAVDRYNHGFLLWVCHAGRAVVLLLLVALGFADLLAYWQLATGVVLVGSMTALYDTTVLASIPALVRTDQLSRANGGIAAMHGVARSAGPGAGGLLVEIVRPISALVVDAATYVVGALAIAPLRRQFKGASRPSQPERIRDGYLFAWNNRGIRRLIASGTLFNFAENGVIAVLSIAVVREAGWSSTLFGAGLSAAGVGGVLAAVWVSRRSHERPDWNGLGPALAVAQLGLLVGVWATTLTGAAGRPLYLATFFLYGVGLTVYNVKALSLRQALTPSHMLGRVNALYRTVAYGALPTGGAVAALLVAVLPAWLTGVCMALTASVAVPLVWAGREEPPQPDEADGD